MMRRIFAGSVWYELATGLLLLAYGSLSSASAGMGDALIDTLSWLTLFAFASIFLSNVLFLNRWLRGLLIAIAVAGAGSAAYLSILIKDLPAFLLFVTLGAGLIISDRNASSSSATERKKGERRTDLSSLMAGTALFLIGSSFAGAAVWTEWFHLHIGNLLFGNGLYLVTSFVFVFAGAGTMLSELNEWHARRRMTMRIVAVFLFLALGASAFLSGSLLSATAFTTVAVIVVSAHFLRFLRIEPNGLKGASIDNLDVYGYEQAGRIAIWMTIMFAITTGFGSPVSPLAIVGYVIASGVSVFYYHFVSIEGYTPRNYLISLLALLLAFAVIWDASGGLASPVTYISFILIIGASVVVNSLWVILVSLSLLAVPALDYLIGRHGAEHPHDIATLGYFSLAVFIIGVYAYQTSRKRVTSLNSLKDAHAAMEDALARERAIQEKYIEKTRRAESSNAELVEMRSALLNVLEDVENTNRELRINHNRQDAIFSSVAEGLIAADTEGKIILANRRASEILGMPHEKILGTQVERTLNFRIGDSSVLETRVFDEAWRGATVILPADLYLTDASGSHIPVGGSVAPFIGAGERIAGIVLAFRDMSVEREIEQQKSSFITVASHQLRTPINAVRWYVDLLLEGDAGKLTKAQKDFITDISTSVIRMANLIDDLLQVSRAEEGRLTLVFEPISAKTLVDDVLKEIAPAAEEREQKVEAEFQKGMRKILTDGKAIKEVLENLLSNAVKYTPEGGKIGIKVTQDGKATLFEVWDTGYGIPEVHTHRVFEKFYRGERAVAMETVGSGLGLYIAKQIVSACKGRIWFESEEGKGTRFYVELPVLDEEEAS